ncbi:GNAT family N-acetyltransferase [Sulfitobacter albidus]|uniref:GNAT family N-acetyltransferase n=1 Tax=Sulfitobacter albidus TaxID=2829501 RepID=A0A975JG26_9RHOB|nr:GNAT family N-acetyltransferase [Sulfitobacter albidus]QUJ77652.1 GNAT family N-acetyltransferase [Sulfitobacter albidus]
MPHTLTTDRLALRPFRVEDADTVVRLIADWDVLRWITRAPYPYTRDDAMAFILRHAALTAPVYAVTRAGQLMGCCSLQEELGYWLGKSFWGQGFATEAARAVLAEHFALSDTSVISGYLLGNAGSAGVLGKLGFTRGKLKIRDSAARGHPVEIQEMTLDAADWRAAA